MDLLGDRLIVGSYEVLEEFDVSDPSHLLRSGWDQTRTYAMGAGAGVNGAGDSLYVVADWEGIAIYEAQPDPGGDIEIHPTRLDFGTVTAARDSIVEVRNSGAGPLTVSFVTSPSGISVAPTAFTVAAGDTQEVVVTATPTERVRGEIRYFSDDPDL
ncbi:MAG: hypothetical protein GY925_30005, partial [Actinomycetia bacterium]|nr:hypothetical protein [Actinomycetes bacterium]